MKAFVYAALAALASAASLVRVSNFGANPANISMSIYVPDKLPAKPAIVLVLHGCGMSGPIMWRTSTLQSYADTRGFIAVVPSTTRDNHCWEVNTAKGLRHGGGGDADSIASTLRYTLNKYKADPKKVFSTGTSSGGMMTNVIAATYPDLIAAGAAFSGVAAGCLAGSPGASPVSADPHCADGKINKSGAQWGAQVRAMYPAFKGTYPRMQIWHGTADRLVKYPNLGEALKEWSYLHGVSFAKNVSNSPQARYTKMVYGDGTKVVGYSAQGVGHTVPYRGNQKAMLDFFGI